MGEFTQVRFVSKRLAGTGLVVAKLAFGDGGVFPCGGKLGLLAVGQAFSAAAAPHCA